MKVAIKAAAVLVLTFVIAKIAYSWSALDPLFDSRAWESLYLTLAHISGVIGPEQGDNLTLLMVLALSFVLALIVVGLASRFVVGPLRRSTKQRS